MSTNIHQKFDALQHLSMLGIDIPPSFILDYSNYFEVLSSLDERMKAGYWVLRTSLEHKSLVKRPAYEFRQLEAELECAFASEPNCILLITRLIAAVRSGIFFKGRDFVYLEYVPGALQSLARDGVSPSRVLFNLQGNILSTQSNCPEFYYSWSRGRLKKRTPVRVDRSTSIKHLITKMKALVRRAPKFSLIEWVEASKGRVLAIDFKQSEDSFLGDYDDINRGLTNGFLKSIPAAWHSDVSLGQLQSREKLMFIESPTYSFVIDNSAFSARRIVLRSGGLLAHLVVECGSRRIPVAISPAIFDARSGSLKR